jgi:nucleoside-diphosphate-sugar epimerase
MKRVLVTGASGFVGRQTIRPLQERGFELHVAGRRAPAGLPGGIEFHPADLLDCATHRPLLDRIRPTHLLHLAWYAEHGKFWEAPENALWLKATLSLVEAFCDAGGTRAVGAGSCAEYDWRFGLLAEGETPESPASLYGAAKLAAGRQSGALAAARGARLAWGRIFFPYGPGEPEARLVPHVITSLLRGEEARCTHGRQFRDFMHVADVGEALAALLDSPVAGAVNLGSGIPVAVGDVAARIASLLGRPDLLRLGAIPDQGNPARMVVASVQRLATEVGWHPRRTLDEGLEEAIRWWRDSLAAKTNET